MGAFLLAGGAKGKRSALPNSRIMIHQPMGGAEGQATDIKIQAEEIIRIRIETLMAVPVNTDAPQVINIAKTSRTENVHTVPNSSFP